jgi:hypothetical protein
MEVRLNAEHKEDNWVCPPQGGVNILVTEK